jgi:hypothetical protein
MTKKINVCFLASSDYGDNNAVDRNQLPLYQQHGLIFEFDEAE